MAKAKTKKAKVVEEVLPVTPPKIETPTVSSGPFTCPDCQLTGLQGGALCKTCKGTPVRH